MKNKMMKKIVLLSALFVSLMVVVALAGVVSASPVCGSTCPAACSAAGQLCTPQEQHGSAVTMQGRELSCVKKQNVGCGFKLEWPFVQGNVCPSGFTRDIATDGAEDCGFLGLGAIFGGSVKYCHVSQEVTCSANATCQSGFQVESSSQCSFQQGGEPIVNQCCQLGFNTITEVHGGGPQVDTNNSNYSQVTSIQIYPDHAVVPLGGQVQFTVIGVTPAGITVTLTDELVWSMASPSYGNLSTTGLFTACANCTGGFSTVWVSHGPLIASASVSVVQITDYRIEPQNVTIAAGGEAILKATALNLATQQRVNVDSTTWSTNVGTLRFPATPNQQSGVAVLLVDEVGNGTIQANAGSGFAANASVRVVSADGFQPSQLIVYPLSPFRISNGQQMALDADFFIVARDSNGVFGPLPAGGVSLHFDAPADALIATVLPGGVIKGVGIGQASLNISSGSLSTIVSVMVSGCTAGTTVACTSAIDVGYLAANGTQSKTCAIGGTWESCRDEDTCDNTVGAPVSPPVQGVADGKICGNWCDSAAGDLDCTCNPANAAQNLRVCSDSVTHCWGTFTCDALTSRYGSCVASPSCTGALFSGVIPPAGPGLFNGYLCGTTAAIPPFTTPAELAASPYCSSLGTTGAALNSIINPTACQGSKNVSLKFKVNPPVALNQFSVSRYSGLNTSFKLSDVTENGVMLNVTDSLSASSFPLLMQIGNTVAYSANITLTGINTSYVVSNSGNAVEKQANVTVEYDSCLFTVDVQLTPAALSIPRVGFP